MIQFMLPCFWAQGMEFECFQSTDKEKNDLLNEIIIKINKEMDSNSSELSFKEVLIVDEVIDIITSFISVPTADQEDEISWDNAITADTTIKEQLNDDNNESD